MRGRLCRERQSNVFPQGSKAQIVPGENLQQLFTIIGFICTIITVVIALLLLASHLRYRANLTEQRMYVT